MMGSVGGLGGGRNFFVLRVTRDLKSIGKMSKAMKKM